MILRYIFCFYTMHLHRAFKVGQSIWAWNSFSVLNLATEMLSKCVFRKKRMIFPWLSLPNRIHVSREQFLIHCQRKPELHQFWFFFALWSVHKTRSTLSSTHMENYITWSPAFSCALGNFFFGFTLSSYWLSRVYFFHLIGRYDNLVLVLRYSSKSALWYRYPSRRVFCFNFYKVFCL